MAGRRDALHNPPWPLRPRPARHHFQGKWHRFFGQIALRDSKSSLRLEDFYLVIIFISSSASNLNL